MGTPWDKYSPKKPSHLCKINNQSVVIKGQLGRDSGARANSAGTYYSLERQLDSSSSPVTLSRKGRPPGVQVEESG